MLDRVKQAGQRLVAIFKAFTPGQKAVTIVAVLTLAIGGFFFATWASKPTLEPLFSNLASADASAIVEKLDADGVKYELTDGGNTILVPKDQVYSLRLTMSGAGLPAGDDSSGYPLLDKQGMTTSEFMQHVTYQRALEGELANTIKSIEGVQAATVHLALPQKDVFADDSQKPTASVLVKTRQGVELTDNQVQAITHLVASSIEGLDPADVTLADAEGSVLSAGGQTTTSGGDARSNQTAGFEQRMSSEIETMLESVVGKGHAVVKVTADLDFDQTESKTQAYTSDPSTAPLAESSKVEKYDGNGNTAVGGVLGPDNIQVPSGTDAAGGNGYENSATTRNNAVNSVSETRKAAPGAIKKLDVAVLLDSKSANAVSTARIQDLIQSAAGIDAKRGDTMAITALPFDQSAAESAKKELAQAAAADTQAQTMSMIKTAAAAAAVALLMLIAAIAGRRNRKKQARTTLTPAERMQLEEAQLALERERTRELEGTSGAPALEAGGRANNGPDILTRRSEISALVDKQPEEVAQLLRGWLADRRETAAV
jgi:flagellar M-ring protein FliF